MTNVATGKPLRVEQSSIAPYLRLPYSQAAEVQEILARAGIWHDLSEVVISVNGGPEMARIRFGRKGNAERIQAILDEGSDERAS